MSDIETMWLVIAAVLGVAVILFVVYLVGSTARNRPRGGKHRATSKDRPHRDTFRTEEPEPEPLKRAAIIVQGAADGLRRQLTDQCVAAGWDEPLWLEVLDGSGALTAATEAAGDGVDVVCVRGDSGVTRSVAEIFAGTETPVSFLPAQPPTVLEVVESGAATTPAQDESAAASTWPGAVRIDAAGLSPAEATSAALATALTGQNTRVDIGRAVLGPLEPDLPRSGTAAGTATSTSTGRETESDPAGAATESAASEATTSEATTSETTTAPPRLVFLSSLVIGDVVADDEPALSTRSVARGLVKGTSFLATVKPDDEDAVARPARSVSFATSERPLTEGDEDKRALDAYLYVSHSIKGWTGVARAMMRKSSRATPLLVPMRSVAFTVTLDRAAALTVDGDRLEIDWPAGETNVLVEPLSLVVRR